MVDTNILEILKKSILLEQQGKMFYEKVAQQASVPALKDFFMLMAKEEDNHIRILSSQYSAVRDKKTVSMDTLLTDTKSDVATQVISPEIKERLSAADFEAAAISAAMAMEERAIRFYRQCGEQVSDKDIIALYRWLSEWETDHLEFLSKIDQELTLKIWNDNNFWPF